MSATLLMRAVKYTDRMLAREMQCPGDKDNALDRIAGMDLWRSLAKKHIGLRGPTVATSSSWKPSKA